MNKKKKTYQELLKENLAEFDTTKTVDVKGPMLDPILGYEGDGELPTYKDAASVLERYYFGEKRSEHEINEVDHADSLDAEGNDKGDSKTEEMKHTEGPEGEEQAGTSAAKDTTGSAKEKEKDIAKEGDESRAEGETVSEKEMNHPDLKSAAMKDSEGPGEEEQAGTGDTYKDFKKRVVESIEEITESADETEAAAETVTEQKEEEKEEKEEKGDDDDKGEEKEEAVEEGKLMKGITDGPEKKSEMGDATKGPDGSYHKDSAKIGQTKEVQKGAFDEADSAVPGGPSPKKRGEDWEDDEHGYSKTNEGEEIELSAEEDITEALENEIIEKLIAEMEEEGDAETVTEQEEEKEEKKQDKPTDDAVEEEEEEGLDVDKKMEEMVTRLTGGEDVTEAEKKTMKHTEGPEGEEQAGTGSMDTVVPDRKDRSNEGDKSKGVKPMDKGELADA